MSRSPPSLRCPACGREYDAGPAEPWRCSCGGPLEFAEHPLPVGEPPDPARVDTREGLWTFEKFLPIGREVTLGEGWTPLVDAPEFECEFKLEYVFPTGSFKDRGAAALLSRALEIGVERVVEDSSGNAGAAIATYAARAGIEAEIYVPADVKESKLRAISRTDASVVRVEGTREDVTSACVERVEEGSVEKEDAEDNAWYASHAWNPAFYAGTQTVAFEIAYQRDWNVPDAVVLPLGHGTLFLGAYRGFRALYDAGWVGEMPRLYGVQATGYDPIARELHSKPRGVEGSQDRNNLADGIRIREPARREEILEAAEVTGGDVISVGETVTERALDSLHGAGFYTEPTCAVAPAALGEYRTRGDIDSDEDVVVPLTGSGLKS